MHVMSNFGYLLGIPAPKALALAPKALATTRHCGEGARHCAEGAGCGDSCSAPRICLEGACQRPKFSKGRLRRAFGQWGPSARLPISCATLAARARESCPEVARKKPLSVCPSSDRSRAPCVAAADAAATEVARCVGRAVLVLRVCICVKTGF